MWTIVLGFLGGLAVGLLLNLRAKNPDPEALAADIISAIERHGAKVSR